MKIRMNGPEDLKALLQNLQGESEDTPRTPIGTLPANLVREYREMARKKERLEREMDNRIEELAIHMKGIVSKEFGDRLYEAEEIHDQLWSKIYEHFGLDPNLSYSIDRRTNVVSVEGESIQTSPFTH
jgi:hypothetical protein